MAMCNKTKGNALYIVISRDSSRRGMVQIGSPQVLLGRKGNLPIKDRRATHQATKRNWKNCLQVNIK